MPKKKQTFKHKRQTDQRKTVKILDQTAYSSPVSFSLSESAYSTDSGTKRTTTGVVSMTIATKDYAYLGKDLIKTGILTGGILIVELIIHFFTK
jgi:hypothetical protein